MKQIRITGKARDDLRGIADYISRDSEKAAQRVIVTLLETFKALGVKNTGRYGRVEGTYEKSVTALPFVIVYKFSEAQTVLNILRVIHTRRDRENIEID